MNDRSGLIWRLISRLPILGRLNEVPDEALKEARDEVVTTMIFAGMPFWFPLVGYLILTHSPPLLHGVMNGELFIYAASLVGPLTYIITKRYGRYVAPSGDPNTPDTPLSYPFPYGRATVATAMIICVVSGLVLTLQRLQYLPEFQSLNLINKVGLAITSVVALIFSTLLIFAVAAYRNFIELLTQEKSDEISGAQRREEDDIFRAWEARRQSQP